MIHPCLLPVGMSTSNRIFKPGYESYQPVVAARQFGFGQVPPDFFLHHLTKSRTDLSDSLTSSRCYSLFDDLHIPIPIDISFTFSAISFENWWSMWKTHVFRKALGPMLQQIYVECEVPEEEVSPSVYYFYMILLDFFSNSVCFLYSKRMVRNPRTMMAPLSSSHRQLPWSFLARMRLPCRRS
jgi:hypothetical protein